LAGFAVADGKRATLEGAGIPLMRQYADAGLDMNMRSSMTPACRSRRG